jgi:hypothetical protein
MKGRNNSRRASRQYYKDPDKYFEVNDKSNAAPLSTNDGGTAKTEKRIAEESAHSLWNYF